MSLKALLPMAAVLLVVNGCARSRMTAPEFAAAGDRYAHDGRYAAAVIEYRNAIKRDPAWAPAHARLAHTYEVIGKYEDAYREYANAVTLDANDVTSRLAAGRLLLDAHMYQETQIRAEQVLER